MPLFFWFSLWKHMLLVPLRTALTSWCNSNELQQHMLLYVCCGHSFKLHWQVDAIKISYTTYTFIYMLWVLIWVALITWCNSNGYQQHTILYMLWVLIWIALISWCNSNELQQHILLYIWCAYSFELQWQIDAIQKRYQQHTLLYICHAYSFELHWQVDAFQKGYQQHTLLYICWGTHLNYTGKLMQFKWVTTYTFICMLWVLIWIALTSWCISNELHNIHFHIYVGTHLNCIDNLMQFKWVPTTYAFIYMLWVLIWIALTSWCISNGYQQYTLLYIC